MGFCVYSNETFINPEMYGNPVECVAFDKLD